MSAWNNLAPTGRGFHEILYLRVFQKSIKKIQVSLKLSKNNGYFTWRDLCTFIISNWIFLGMRNITGTICRENQNTHFMFSNFFPKIVSLWEIMWKNIVEPDRPQMTVLHMRFAYQITTAADTHLEYVIFPSFFYCNSVAQTCLSIICTYPVLFLLLIVVCIF
jgi:hypothetical protein